MTAAQRQFVLFACRDVALDTNVSERLAESAAHCEDSEFVGSLLTVLRVANDFAGELVRLGQLAFDFLARLFVEFVGERLTFQILIGVAKQGKVSAVC